MQVLKIEIEVTLDEATVRWSDDGQTAAALAEVAGVAVARNLGYEGPAMSCAPGCHSLTWRRRRSNPERA